jgi:predicted transposase/invertase (TIGR01784 family)
MDQRKIGRANGEVIPLTYNYMFVTILDNPENIIILENFLSCYLDIPLDTIRGNLSLNKRDLPIEHKKEKNKQVDLILKIDNDIINIEMNNSFDKDIKERNVVYGCAIHGKQLAYGADYKNIHKFLQINFDNSTESKNITKFIENFVLMDSTTKRILSNKFSFDVIHMQTSSALCYNNREKKLYYWCKAFQAKDAKELLEILEVHELMEEKAQEKYLDEVDKYSTDDEVYQIYSEYTREEMERNTANKNLEIKQQEVEQYEQSVKQQAQEVEQKQQEVEQYEKNVKQQAKEVEQKQKDLQAREDKLNNLLSESVNKGKKSVQIEMVKKLFNKNMSPEEISEITDLSVDEIKKLLNN